LKRAPITCQALTPLRSVGALLTLLLIFSSSSLLTGCQKRVPATPDTSVTIDYQIEPQPPRVGPAVITLKISDAAGKPVQGAEVNLEANMTHAGMAPSFGSAREIAPGQYRGPMNFSMSGDWIILVTAVVPAGQKIEKQFAIKGVAG